jgi:hypothetical protein
MEGHWKSFNCSLARIEEQEKNHLHLLHFPGGKFASFGAFFDLHATLSGNKEENMHA